MMEKVTDWIAISHDLQQSFGAKDFLVIAPQGGSGVVLDAPAASKLPSAVAIAMPNCSRLYPKNYLANNVVVDSGTKVLLCSLNIDKDTWGLILLNDLKFCHFKLVAGICSRT